MSEARGAPRGRPRPTDGALVLLRHGESTTNAADRFTGRLDSPLTVVGIAQAHGAAALVAHNVARVDAIVSSPMLRARQTASVIAQDLGVADEAIEIATALTERDLGALTGMSKSRVPSRSSARTDTGRFAARWMPAHP
jgi:2,3-bisphosphoglycerate-dependent phosphoglycerate mutase